MSAKEVCSGDRLSIEWADGRRSVTVDEDDAAQTAINSHGTVDAPTE